MRYLLDTNIYIYATIERESLCRDVQAILMDYDNEWCISTESVRELIVGFNNGGIVSRYWQTAKEMVEAISNNYFVTILPLNKSHMNTYAQLEINVGENHKDPSDHVIISQAITEKIPLISSDNKFKFYCRQGLDLIFNKK